MGVKIQPSSYVLVHSVIHEECLIYGYNAVLHGSVARDLDIIAIPWTKDAIEPEILVRAVIERLKMWGPAHLEDDPKLHPHGRLVWTLLMDMGFVDFGVMPKLRISKKEKLE